MAEGKLQLLVKARPGFAGRALSLSGVPDLQVEDLRLTMDRTRGAAAAAAPRWMQATATTAEDGVNPWDLCHRLVTEAGGLGAAGAVSFAEPDLEQQWLDRRQGALAFGGGNRCEVEQPQDADAYAVGPRKFWHLDDNYSGLRAARSTVQRGQVRIAHLDTGYDPKHETLPKHLRTDLQKNFVDGDRPDDATDEPTALLNPMFGHGTATLAILAGSAIRGEVVGGAPQLDVVPLRVANWVTLIKNSAIVKAFDYVLGLWGEDSKRIEVVAMSMGGLASQAWAEAVNALYERGIFVVTAAGNNYANVPGYIVYPARFNRVVAACGVMANRRPYADLPALKMAGCYGPDDKMRTALAAWTPNLPWAKIHCGDGLDWDGGGTSAATPQVAAAAALWLQQHQGRLTQHQGWQRVEAVRQALFGAMPWPKQPDETQQRLGRRNLNATEALRELPGNPAALRQEEPDRAGFALWKVLFGAAGEAASPGEAMLELEALQLSQRTKAIEDLLRESGAGDDPANPASFADPLRRRRIAESLADHPEASRALRERLQHAVGSRGAAGRRLRAVEDLGALGDLPSWKPPKPSVRRLRVYSVDPLSAIEISRYRLAAATLEVPWEENLQPGPIGEYLQVIDIDPPSQAAYAPVDLNHPYVLADGGLAPSEGSPQFHQQMVYAVAMTTIGHFEKALGRVALWAERRATIDGSRDSRFVRRLRIYPHALREANAYYSPEHRALLFGYFRASEGGVGQNLPGGLVFTCLSHDIVAHETTHALLDGLHPRYREMTNPDLLAFHEAFADIVALFQHFTMPEALRTQIAEARGDLSMSKELAGLARQFGQAIGERDVLRSAIQKPDSLPEPGAYKATIEPHLRGSYLVAAVFQAFLAVYKEQTADLLRIATSGTGVLPEGQLHPDLVERLAQAAATIAGRILRICIRALDYCPPVDLGFGEYLRALITADHDVVPNDQHGYRVAFVSAFRTFGIFPDEVATLSTDALLWRGIDDPALNQAFKAIEVSWDRDGDRLEAYRSQQVAARQLHRALMKYKGSLSALGLAEPPPAGRRWRVETLDGVEGRVSPIEVHSVRPANRVTPDDRIHSDLIVELTQRWCPGKVGNLNAPCEEFYRGGATVICDPATGAVRYVVRKRLGSRWRVEQQRQDRDAMRGLSLADNYFLDGQSSEPFALLHRMHQPG